MFVKNLKNLFGHTSQHSKYGHVRGISVVKKSLKYSQFGEPAEVLEMVEDQLDDAELKGNEVLVKVLAAPINPADINTIQGKYPVKPQFPAIGGNECVGIVANVGRNVQHLKPGQRVVPAVNALGTWTTYALFTEDQLMSISEKIGIAEAATITVNPCTAYRMLKDFVDLKPGDCVIQNGANSAVGQSVHQLCKAWGLKSLGVVRDRPNVNKLKAYLQGLGATEVCTEEEMRTTTLFKKGVLPKPRLALNCVGGKSATDVTRQLDTGGVMVTYGGMSREPVIAPTAALIFNDLKFCGFWMTRWSKQYAQSEKRAVMFNEICDLMEEGKFVAPKYMMVPMAQYKEAVEKALSFKGFTGKKFLLDMTSA